MTVKALIRAGEYHDSIRLMQVARALTETAGVQDAAAVMATEANKSILASAGLLTDQVRAATANDLAVVVRAEAEVLADASLRKAEALLKERATRDEVGELKPRTLRTALSVQPETNVAVISVAGRYAAEEAQEALRLGLHVLLFSDHVSIEDEVSLKTYARDHGLLLMGPGAGTAILNQTALGFANVVPAGPIGIVSAAGTGLQEVSTLLARNGGGISQGIGVGGRDLSREVGGIMMLEGLKALQQDIRTEVIVLISKPPAAEVEHSILKHVSEGKKPTVVCFLGGDLEAIKGVSCAVPARTLQESALLALDAAHIKIGSVKETLRAEGEHLIGQASALKSRMASGQRYLRGLFSGGTLCYEAQVVWKDMLIHPVRSNAPLPGEPVLENPMQSRGHTAADLGEEEFTSGRLHPMIDQTLRIRRLLQEAGDPGVAAIMLDVVLGYGAHPDPASELGPALEQAHALAGHDGRALSVVVSVTGTEQDPQCLSRVASALERAGALVCDSNAAAARLTGLLVSG